MWRCAVCRKYSSVGKRRCNSTISHVCGWLQIICWIGVCSHNAHLSDHDTEQLLAERFNRSNWGTRSPSPSIPQPTEPHERERTLHNEPFIIYLLLSLRTATAVLWCRCMRGWRTVAWNFISCTTWFSPHFWPQPQSSGVWPLIVCFCVCCVWNLSEKTIDPKKMGQMFCSWYNIWQIC